MTEHVYLILTYVLISLASLGLGFFLVRKTQLISLAQHWLQPRRSFFILLFFIVLYTVIFTGVGIAVHNNFGTRIFDLGNMEQAMWNTAHGDPLHMTTFYPETNRLFIHVEPIFFVLAPFYALWQDPRMLLFLQVAVVALGALPLYLFAKRRFGSELLALGFGITYLLLPALHQGIFLQFRPLVLAVPFILFAWHYYEEKKYSLSFIFFLLAMTCREDVAFMVLLFGIIFLFSQQSRRFGVGLLCVSLLWLGIVYGVVYPTYAGLEQPVQYSLFQGFGGSPIEVVKTVITHPLEMIAYTLKVNTPSYLLYLFVPFLCLGLFRPLLLVPALVSLAIVFFHKDANGLMTGVLHYHAPIMAPVSIASVYGASSVFKKFKVYTFVVPLVAVTMVVIGILLLPQSIAYMSKSKDAGFFPHEYSASQKETARKAIAMIPDTASVVASYQVGAHLAGRKELYLVGTPQRMTADYVVLTVYPSYPCPDAYPLNEDGTGPLRCEGTEKQYQEFIQELRFSPDHEVLLDEHDIVLFMRRDS